MTKNKTLSSAQWSLALLIFALAAARLAYGAISENGLRETAALFIGLPAFFAIIITLTPKAKSVTGMIIKGTIIAMLMSGIILQEGFVCILMASPLFLGVGLVIGAMSESMKSNNLKASFILIIPFLFLSLEGTSEALSFNRDQIVIVERILPINESTIESTLAKTPNFERPLPPFLQLGFPRPRQTSGKGLAIGDERIIYFGNGKQQMGQLEFIVSEHGENHVQFQAVQDNTPIAEWLTWQTTDVTWQAIDVQQTSVTITITTERRLSPAFYFGPLEKHGVEQAANYLMDSWFATETGE